TTAIFAVFPIVVVAVLILSGDLDQKTSTPRAGPSGEDNERSLLVIGDKAIMSTTLNDNLPEILRSLRTRSLFVMRLDVRELQDVGATPSGYRRIGVVPGGSFEGERLSGEVLDGGSDWQTVRTDGATTLNV